MANLTETESKSFEERHETEFKKKQKKKTTTTLNESWKPVW